MTCFGNGKSQGVGVLGPLLRPRPQQPDQLRRHADRVDPRRAGLRARRIRHLPHARRPGGAGRVLLADDEDAVHRRLAGRLRDRPRQQHELRRAVLQPPDPRHHRGLRPRALRGPERLPRSDQRIRTRCSSATTTSGTRRTLARTSSSARSPAASANFQGLEFVFRKRFANRWQMLTSYNWNDAQGQHQLRLERGLPGRRGLPRSARAQPVRHAAGPDQEPDQGRRVLLVRLRPAAGRHVQLELGHGGQPHVPGVGTQPAASRDGCRTPSSSPATPRAGWRPTRWVRSRIPRGVRWTCARSTCAGVGPANVEFFVDVFNVLDSQGPVRNQDLVAGSGGKAFGDEIKWVSPRRAFLGARVRF